jgi:hypothetical protein
MLSAGGFASAVAAEILQLPPGKGDARWQRPSDSVFLGIDHTAIVVENPEWSLRFYRDTLGLGVVGGSEKHGPEQERLNDGPGARLRITTLRATEGPGICRRSSGLRLARRWLARLSPRARRRGSRRPRSAAPRAIARGPSTQ